MELMNARMSGRSTRFEYVTPAQFGFVTYEFTARTVFVPLRIFGPPESPKQLPPVPCDGFAVSLMNSALVTLLLWTNWLRSEEHTSELQSLRHLVCRLLLEKEK